MDSRDEFEAWYAASGEIEMTSSAVKAYRVGEEYAEGFNFLSASWEAWQAARSEKKPDEYDNRTVFSQDQITRLLLDDLHYAGRIKEGDRIQSVLRVSTDADGDIKHVLNWSKL